MDDRNSIFSIREGFRVSDGSIDKIEYSQIVLSFLVNKTR